MSETEQNTSGKKLNELRVVDLKQELERRNLDRSGVKTALIDRLTEALQKEGKDPENHIFEVSSDVSKAKPTTPRLSRRSLGNTEVTQEEDSCSMESNDNDEVEENGEVEEINKDEIHQEEKKEKQQHDEEAQKNAPPDETISEPVILLMPLSSSSLTLEAAPNSDSTSIPASNEETKASVSIDVSAGDSIKPTEQKSIKPEDSAANAPPNSAENASVNEKCSDGQQETSKTSSSSVQDPTADIKKELPKSATDMEMKSPTDIEKPVIDVELESSKPSLDIEKDTPNPATVAEKKSSNSKSVIDKKSPKSKTSVVKKSAPTSVEKKLPTKATEKSANSKSVDTKSPKRRVAERKPAVTAKKCNPKSVNSSSTVADSKPPKRRGAAERKKSASEKGDELKSVEVKDRHTTAGEVSESSNNATTELAENGKSSLTDNQSSTPKKNTSSRTAVRGTKRKVSESKPSVGQDGTQKTENSQSDDKKEIEKEKSEGVAPDPKKSKSDLESDEKKSEKKKKADGERKPTDKREIHSKERKRRSRSRDRLRRNPWPRARQPRHPNFIRTFPRRGNVFDRYGGPRRLLASRKSPLSPMLDNDRFHRANERRRDVDSSIVEHRAAEIARKNRDEALRIERERDRLRHEKEKLERLRAEVLRKEREQQRAERERLERERDELRRRSQIQLEERRSGLKRTFEDSIDSWDRGIRGGVGGVREIEAPQRYNDYARTAAPFPGRNNQFEGRRRTEVVQEIVTSRRVSERSVPSRRRGNNVDRKSREKAYDRPSDRNNFDTGRGRAVETPQPWSDSPNDRQQGKYAASSTTPSGSHWGSTRNPQNWIPVVGPPLPPQPPQEHWSRIDSHGQPPSNMNRQPNIGPPSQLPPVFGGPRNEIMGGNAPMGNYSGNRYNVVRRF